MKRFITLFILFLAAFVFLVQPAIAAGPSTLKPNVWKAKNTFKHEAEFDGVVDLDNATVTGTGVITGTNVANVTRSFPLLLGAGGVDGGNDVDDATAPDLSSCDGVPCIVWADTSETTAVGWTFRLPSDFVSGLVVYALVSSNAAATGVTLAGQLLDWAVFVNIDGTAFDATPIPQAAVAPTEVALNTKNDVLTLTSDTTAEAAYAAGVWVTLEFFNGNTHNANDMELKGLEVTYTATQ